MVAHNIGALVWRSCSMDCADSEQYRRLGISVFCRIDRSAGASHLGVSRQRWGGI